MRNWKFGLLMLVAMGLLACGQLAAEPVSRNGAEAVELKSRETADSLAAVSERIWRLAGTGRFDEALQEVHAVTRSAEAGTPLSSLKQELETHTSHVRQQQEQARRQHERHMQQLQERMAEDKLVEALTHAVSAYSLAEEPKALLGDPKIRKLVRRAEARAVALEDEGRWLRAMSLYQRLAALHEEVDRERFTDPLRRVARRAGLLRLYAPDVLYAMYKRNAQEDGDEEPAPWNFEEDHWQTQLEHIDVQLLLDALDDAAGRYVEGSNFEQLLIGGIEWMEVLLSTGGLEGTFPVLADREKVDRFTSYLRLQHRQMDQRIVPMRSSDAAAMVRAILKHNEQTLGLPEVVVVHELGEGALARLDDFSSIIWPHAKSRFERTTTQKFSGVGIQISLVDGQLTVVTPLEGTPAHQAGIRPGDRIVTIEGKSTIGIDLETAVDKITGPEGTEVMLGIQSPGTGDPREVTLKRSSIRIVSVKGWERLNGPEWDYYIDPQMKIGYVRMSSFGPDTADELDQAVQGMLKGDGLNGLILDLRANPGGRLDAAIDVSDRFLNRGVIVSTTQRGLTGRPMAWAASPSKTYPGFHLIVLINGASASASEIVSGAIKDHDRGLVIGDRTFGKGSVQNLYPVAEGRGYLKLTTQYYRLPDGKIIHRRPGEAEWGVEPDVRVRMTERQEGLAYRARTLLDILREDGEEIDPRAVMNLPADGEDEDEEVKLPPIRSARDILTYGLDPQLETALLLMKTRVIGRAEGIAGAESD